MMSTPWGPSQHIREIAPGISWVDTASHGGVHLSADRYTQLPSALRRTFAGGAWFKEDADWAIVACFFETEWRSWADSTDWTSGDKDLELAWKILRRWRPEAIELLKQTAA